MKNIIKKITIALAVSLTLLVGCTKFFDKIEDFNVGVTNTIFEQSAVIELTDLFGNKQDIIDTDFTIELTGADANKLVNEAGENTITENDGFIQLSVNPNKSTGVKELNFNITISGGTYKTETFALTIKDTVSYLPIPLLNKAKDIGVTAAQGSATLTNNATTSSSTIKTSLTNTFTTTSITIPTETTFMDENSMVVTGSKLDVSIRNVDALGIISDRDIDFDNMEISDAVGSKVSGKNLNLIGYSRINMVIGGKAIKEFSKPIKMTIQIPSKMPNLETGTAFKVGDSYPIYSNNGKSSNWSFHQNGTVTAGNTSDFFNIEFTTNNVSVFGAGALTNELNSKTLGASCTLPVRANLLPITFVRTTVLSPLEIGNLINSMKKVITTPSVFYVSKKTIWSSKGLDSNINTVSSTGTSLNPDLIALLARITQYAKTLNIDDISDVLKVQVETDEIGNKTTSVDTTKDNICDGVSNLADQANKIPDITINVSAKCNGKTFVPDGVVLYVEKEDSTFRHVGTIKNGKLTLKGFKLGKEYNFKIIHKEKSFINKWTFTSQKFEINDFNLPKSVCDKL
ncbi:hypothetical protein [Polaribacter uvawellassae]|uniref:hypothetical protein n=1 Tax=Polaribacter uvawellassae TaxID=3133495 RepID=UPI00321BDAFD